MTVYYTIASGSLLVINKVAIVQLPAPTFVLVSQLLFSVAAVQVRRAAFGRGGRPWLAQRPLSEAHHLNDQQSMDGGIALSVSP
jgi:hypothetical protein